MANQKLARVDVGSCFKNVKMLIEELPEEIFRGDSDLEKKKKRADAALEVLEKFFNMLSTVKRDEVYKCASNLNNFKHIFLSACGKGFPTIDL